ncbi:MAG: 2OG-Fe(II) oxygenase [Rhodospirillaceae bacterium]|nr:2OG-Fe(II) oxygenase [Rhodospirillaceae bacterium]MYB14123.1 2OG-Fe(II) oxygenase [Rhodospirillaceae bacterium]MYI49598.1 2OG-Fe(II) oxygenase [Rhodospirillaceae bacterium]
MRHILDLDRFPLDRPDSPPGRNLLYRCRRDLDETGMFSLPGLIRPEALARCVADLEPLFETAAFTHSRQHNIYFDDAIRGVAPDHPALRRFDTINHTVCADQIPHSPIAQVYGWQPLIDFLAATLEKARLYEMADPLARINVMAYGAGEQLNWHFDRAEFTTTCLLQAPLAGGVFQYRSGLRSDTDPNYEGVGRLLAGEDGFVRSLPLTPGTLNVFKGKNTAHRVTPVEGDRARIVAVFSYFEEPDVAFSKQERLDFYGRAGP